MSTRSTRARSVPLGALLVACVFAGPATGLAAPTAAQAPELIVQTGHSATVNALALSHDGKWLASGGEDHSVRVWDLASGREIRTLREHPEPVTAVAWSLDDTRVASGGYDGKIRLWDTASGRLLSTIPAHQGFVTALAFGLGGQTLLSSGTDKTLKLWTYASGHLLRSIELAESANTLAFSRDERILATGSVERVVRLWDTTTWRELRSLRGGKGAVNTVAFSPDGHTLAFGSDDTEDEAGATVHLYDVTDGRGLRTFKVGTPYVFAVNFSPDGHTLAVANEGAQVLLWDLPSGRSLHALAGHSDAVKSLLYLFDGHLASGGFDGQIRIWDTAAGRTQRLLAGDTSPVNAIAVSEDGKLLASANEDHSISLWRLLETQQPQRLIGHSNVATAVAFSPDASTLATGSLDGEVRIWSTEDGHEVSAIRAQRGEANVALTLAFSPNGRTLATGADVDHLQLWDVATGRALRSLKVSGSGDPEGFAFSPDGRVLAVATADGGIETWDVALGKSLRRLQAIPVAGSTAPAPYDSLSFSADGGTLASGRAAGIDLWDLRSGQHLRSLSRSPAPGTYASPTFRRNAIWPQTFSRDSRLLAGGADDGTISVWDTGSGERVRTATGHRGNVTSIRFVGDGSLLVSGGEDATLRLRDTATGRELAQLITTGATEGLVVTPDGLFDGAPAAWQKILWRFSPRLRDVAPVEIFFNEFFYPNLLAELLQHKRPQAAKDLARRDRRQPEIGLTVADIGAKGAPRKVNVHVSVADTGGGARDVRLFRNGSLVKAWRGDALAGKKTVALDTSVTVVAGANRLVAYAFNGDNVKSGDGTLLVQGEESLRRRGVLYVLAVGINRYANHAFDLSFAVADAQTLTTEVQRQQQGLTQFVRVEPTLLLDQSATKKQLLDSLAELAHVIQPEDSVVLFFAGHGLADDPRFYLIPHDLGYDGPRTSEALSARAADIFTHGISDEELARALEPLDAAQLLLIIDACNSGQVLETTEKRRGPMNSRGLAQLAYEKGMYILTAAQSYEEALETTQLGHGLLTYTLVEEGLKQGRADAHPADGQIDAREWFDYAVRRVPLVQSEQRPRVFYRREPPATVLVVGRRDRNSKTN